MIHYHLNLMINMEFIVVYLLLCTVFCQISAVQFNKPINIAEIKNGGSCLASTNSHECSRALDGHVTHTPSFKWGFNGWPNGTWIQITFSNTYKVGQVRFTQMYFADECNFRGLRLTFMDGNGNVVSESEVELIERNNAYNLESFDITPTVMASSVNISVTSVYVRSQRVYSGFTEIVVMGVDSSLPWPGKENTTTTLPSERTTTQTNANTRSTTIGIQPQASSDEPFKYKVYGPVIGVLLLIVLISGVLVILLYRKSRRNRRRDEIYNDIHNIDHLGELRLRREVEIMSGNANETNVYFQSEVPSVILPIGKNDNIKTDKNVNYSSKEQHIFSIANDMSNRNEASKEAEQSKRKQIRPQVKSKPKQETEQNSIRNDEVTPSQKAGEKRLIIGKLENATRPQPKSGQHTPLKKGYHNELISKSTPDSDAQGSNDFAQALKMAVASMESKRIAATSLDKHQANEHNVNYRDEEPVYMNFKKSNSDYVNITPKKDDNYINVGPFAK